MRWSNLTVPTLADRAAPAAPPLPLALPGATVRTFDTPAFAGMTYYEIQAKSIINRVPGRSRVPFEWTINPYRGCSHACSYCLAGDTPILMADGSTRPLAQIRVGDPVVGTMGAGPHRRYVPTTVHDHWSVTKASYRVTLADGTRLVAGGGHRFLTRRGWRHVSPDEPGCPALTVGDVLSGVGHFAEAPKESPDYRAGYLCGLMRGDAGAPPGPPREGDAWIRADGYLEDIPLHQALRWPDLPTGGWYRGFLAGAFGSTGHTDRLAIVFTSHDRTFRDRITDALTHLGLPSRRPGQAPRTVQTPRDLWVALRFGHLTGAPDARLDASGVGVRSDPELTVVGIEPLGVTMPLWDISTGTGDFIADGVVSHNCFARNTHTYLDLDAGHDFDTKVVVKVNAGDLVRRELAAPKWSGAHIAMGTNVDVYQRAEGRYRLMPPILAALRDFANPFSVLTKGTLILRDLPLLREAASVTEVGLSVSVGFVDETTWRAVEPGTPSPRRRLDVVRRLTDAGFAVSVLMAPILPGLTDTDESVEETVAAIAAAGATGVHPLGLHLRPGAKEWYAAWLTRTHPELAPRYREMYGDGAYLPQTYQHELAARVRMAARRHGLHRATPGEARSVPGEARSVPGEARSVPGEAHSVPGEDRRSLAEARSSPGEARRLPGEADGLPDGGFVAADARPERDHASRAEQLSLL